MQIYAVICEIFRQEKTLLNHSYLTILIFSLLLYKNINTNK